MLRIPESAAKVMLARGEADIYLLSASGAEKLSPLAAVHGLKAVKDCAFAIKPDALPRFEKWAHRTNKSIIQRIEHGNHKKSKAEQL
jgi:hypothetical protein